MPFFRVSVRRPHEGPNIRAEAGMIWWGVGGRQEVELAEITIELQKGPAREVLARALLALVAALEEDDQGV